MGSCRGIRRRLDELAAFAEPPARDREHLAVCDGCREALAARRLTNELVRRAATPLEPPRGFAARVQARLAPAEDRRARESDMWRPAWGLVPTFAAILAGLLFWQGAAIEPEPVDLVPVESFTSGERLLLETGELTPEMILAAVVGGNGR